MMSAKYQFFAQTRRFIGPVSERPSIRDFADAYVFQNEVFKRDEQVIVQKLGGVNAVTS